MSEREVYVIDGSGAERMRQLSRAMVILRPERSAPGVTSEFEGPVRQEAKGSESKYVPHQGKKEMARRLRRQQG